MVHVGSGPLALINVDEHLERSFSKRGPLGTKRFIYRESQEFMGTLDNYCKRIVLRHAHVDFGTSI